MVFVDASGSAALSWNDAKLDGFGLLYVAFRVAGPASGQFL